MSGPRGQCDLAVVGAGILGLATARELRGATPTSSLQVIDARVRSPPTRPATTPA